MICLIIILHGKQLGLYYDFMIALNLILLAETKKKKIKKMMDSQNKLNFDIYLQNQVKPRFVRTHFNSKILII